MDCSCFNSRIAAERTNRSRQHRFASIRGILGGHRLGWIGSGGRSAPWWRLPPTSPPLECVLVGYRLGKEIARSKLTLTGKPPYRCRASFDPWPTELALFAKSAAGVLIELARQPIEPVLFEAAAIARPDEIIHPVDLGTILVPSDWLLLADGRKGTIDVAAICRSSDVPNGRVAAWFESAPAAKTATDMPLVKDRRAQVSLPLPPAPATVDHDVPAREHPSGERG